ncbi:MAG: PQQ-like beta-propeller repeat protein, partial [Planctomycetes bacterium]|nr:PQQ-like beta-propeller repeat protein [Planctomycetota bacterium]
MLRTIALAGCLGAAAPCQLVLSPMAGAQSAWPRFRGSDGSGHATSTDVPIHWGPDDVNWRVELPGQGHSSACVWDQWVFLTAAIPTDAGKVKREVLCLDCGDGHLIWKRVASVTDGEDLHKMNSYATPSCATDGTRVVAFFGRGGIHCYDTDGQLLWSRDLGSFPGPWGVGASPIFVGDLIVQNCDAEGESALIALDKRSGETVWRTDRGNLPRGGWNTPILVDTPSRRELIVNGELGVNGYDPGTGRELWFCKSFNGRGTPTPAAGHGMLFVISGKAGDVYAVRPGGEGDVTASRMVWHTRRTGGRDLSSPILVDKYLFVVNMAGIASCYDCATGREL